MILEDHGRGRHTGERDGGILPRMLEYLIKKRIDSQIVAQGK